MRRRTALVALVVLLLATIPLPPQAAAHATGPNLERLSFDPAPGDYTLLLRVENFKLVPHNASAGDTPGEGQIRYLINGFPCAGECSRGAPSRTDSPSFTYRHLVAGDNITAELLTNTGKPVNVTVVEEPEDGNATVDEEAGDEEIGHEDGTQAPANKTRPVRLSVIVAHRPSTGPLLSVVSGIPNAGDYTMRLNVTDFTLVPPGAEDVEEAVDTGHVVYSRNGVPCEDTCSDAPGTTDATTFTFRDVNPGDRLSAELVRPDGSSLAPARSQIITVTTPAIVIVSGPPMAGDATVQVRVTGFTLAAPGAPTNAGLGHVRYLLKPKGSFDLLEPRACEAGDRPSDTAATSFKFCGLDEGDQVTAQLVSGGRTVASAQPLTVTKRPEEGFVSPGIGPVLAVLLLGLALRRR